MKLFLTNLLKGILIGLVVGLVFSLLLWLGGLPASYCLGGFKFWFFFFTFAGFSAGLQEAVEPGFYHKGGGGWYGASGR